MGLLLIALFKLFKAALLIVVGIGALKLIHADVVEAVMEWVSRLQVDPDNRFIHGVLSKIFDVTPQQLKALSFGSFFYAALLGTEGVGLLLQKRWAEYFTVITTGLLVPLEIYEMVEHLTWVKVAVLLINIAIVWYLVVRLRSELGKREVD